MPQEKRQNLAKTDRGSYYGQNKWLEFLDDKAVLYSGSERDDSKNYEENYNENIEAVLRRYSSK